MRSRPTRLGRPDGELRRPSPAPVLDLEVHFREGERSPLATPDRCGAISTGVDFAPWRAAVPAHLSLPAAIVAGAGDGACPSGPAPFAPGASGGTLNSAAGRYSPFYLHLTRTDTEQEITSYSVTLPPGISARSRGSPAARTPRSRRGRGARASRSRAPSRPPASLIGHTLAGYGVGPVHPFAPGALYLAGPYRGSDLGRGDPLRAGRALRPGDGGGGARRSGSTARAGGSRSTRRGPTRSPTSSTASRSTCATSAPRSTGPK